jgi:DeoR family transcriptional regulator, glycerol-3-phosphate regulon repressor
VTLLGGELSDHEEATFGLDTVQQLDQYHADYAFVGAGGITTDGWLTDYSRMVAEVRSRMLMATGCAIVVADQSKFGRVTPVRINGFERVRYVITEVAPDKSVVRAIAARGPELIVAGA